MKPHARPLHDGATIRAKVSPDEHIALWRISRERLGMTLGDFVLAAVRAHVEKTCGLTLEKAAENCRNAGRMVQLELF